MNTYTLTSDGRSAIRSSDGASIPWDATNNRPLDFDGYVGRIWIDEGSPTPIPPPAPTLEELKAKALAALAELRWRAETSGTIVNSMNMQTDEQTQTKLTAAVVASGLDNNYSVQWKLADGTFATFSHDQLIAIAQGVRAHVQGCFDREATLSAQIEAATDDAALATIDLSAGWPAR